MLAKRLLALFAALLIGLAASPAQAQSHTRAEIEVLAQYYAQYYDVPLELVRRVINRESTFNPSARNGPYYGLMQIHPTTARTMGFRGQPSELLNAETNLIYAVKYLRGAWLLANGSHDRAVHLYAKGYYYEARAAGLLEETGLRPGPRSPVAPTPPQAAPATAVAQAPEPAPAAQPAVDPIQVAAIDAAAPVQQQAAPAIAPLGFLPPARPLGLEVAEEEAPADNAALVAIAAVQAPPSVPSRPQQAEPEIAEAEPVEAEVVSAFAEAEELGGEPEATEDLRPSLDLVAGTFALLEAIPATRP